MVVIHAIAAVANLVMGVVLLSSIPTQSDAQHGAVFGVAVVLCAFNVYACMKSYCDGEY